jgi:hypothetical protein
MGALESDGVLKEKVELKRPNVCVLLEERSGRTFSAARGARRAMRGIIKHGAFKGIASGWQEYTASGR